MIRVTAMENFNKVLSTIKLLVKSIVSAKIAPSLTRQEIQQRLYGVIDDALKEIGLYPKD
jgi:hypothetical protein